LVVEPISFSYGKTGTRLEGIRHPIMYVRKEKELFYTPCGKIME